MPRFPKGFGRRKSSGNVLEELQNEASGETSFRVFERPSNSGNSFDGGVKFKRPSSAHLDSETSGRKDDNMFEALKGNRDSGASHTNTVSTGDQSSRRSATSTAPSSTTDLSAQEEWKSPHDKPFTNIPPPPIPRSSTSSFLKNAGRTFSFGRKPASPTKEEDRKSQESDTGRERAVTASSYASTAIPPRLEETSESLSFGGDFGDMFNSFGKRASVIELEKQRALTSSPETLQTAPLAKPRSSTISRVNQPAPINIDKTSRIEASPYSWTSNTSGDGLMGNISPPPLPEKPLPVPKQENVRNLPSYGNPTARPPRPGGPVDPGLRRSGAFNRRQSTLEYNEVEDEDARLLRASLEASRHLENPRVQTGVRKSWAKPLADVLFDTQNQSTQVWQAEPTEKTHFDQPSPVSDVSMAEAASLADHLISKSPSASPPLSKRPQPSRVMTPAQFARYREDKERLRTEVGAQNDAEEEEAEEDHYEDDDDEDETERLKQVAKQRRKQEAHMAVYRQTMMKVTGETAPTRPLPPPQTQSSPNLLINGKASDDEEEDDDVPLAILSAHGFPNKTRAPGQLQTHGSHPNLRASSQMAPYPAPPGSITAGSVAGGLGGRLPVFARHLPQDPYFGASLVNPTNRESLAFGGGAGSVHGGPATSPGIPGGLVGVIANEERARAMRRGSPNTAGEYPQTPLQGPGAMGMGGGMHTPTGMPGMSMGMGMPMGSVSPMMLTPGDQAQIQMTQQMQQFMQMQMQFMQMMAGGQGQNVQAPRPMSANGLQRNMPNGSMLNIPGATMAPGGASRPLSMMDPNAAPWPQPNGGRMTMYAPSMHLPTPGYTPSIAPSERSNVGLPGRYRPVSQLPPVDKSRTSTMSGALNDWSEKNKSMASIKVVSAAPRHSALSADDDEDDEEGWEEMKRKREKKKSAWRLKKGNTPSAGLKEMMGLAA